MLFRVLRGGLEFLKYLGMTAGRANEVNETAPRTLVPDPRATGEGNRPRTADLGVRVSSQVSSSGSHQRALLSSTVAG